MVGVDDPTTLRADSLDVLARDDGHLAEGLVGAHDLGVTDRHPHAFKGLIEVDRVGCGAEECARVLDVQGVSLLDDLPRRDAVDAEDNRGRRALPVEMTVARKSVALSSVSTQGAFRVAEVVLLRARAA